MKVHTLNNEELELNLDLVVMSRKTGNNYYLLLKNGDKITIKEDVFKLKYVDWILSTGTQYIKTGVIGDMDLEFEGDFTATTANDNCSNVFGYIIYYQGTSSNQVRFHFGKSIPGVGSHVGGTNIGNNFIVGDTYTLEYKDRIFIVESDNESETADYTSRNLTDIDLAECYLFARHDIDLNKNDVPTCFSKGKISYWKIWDKNGNLIRDYKPCIYDGVPGMWDLVECKFYGSASSTAFIAPTTSDVTVTNNYKLGKFKSLDNNEYVININNIVTSKLVKDDIHYLLYSSGDLMSVYGDPFAEAVPPIYTRIKYLQSTGTQYLDTGYSDGNGFRIVTEFMQTGDPGKWAAIMGTENESGKTPEDRNSVLSYVSLGTNYGGIYNGLRFNLGSNKIFLVKNNTVQLNKWYELDASSVLTNRFVIVDGKKEELLEHGQNAHALSSLSFYLFALHVKNGADLLNMCALGPTKFYNSNGELIHNYIPVKRNSDGVLGMYDPFADHNSQYTFITNKGTGSFIAGPDVV